MIRVALVVYGMIGGGIETFLLNLGVYLNRCQYDVTIVTTNCQGNWFERIAQNGLQKVYVSGLNPEEPLEHVSRVSKVLYDGNYDVVFLNHALFAQFGIGTGKGRPVVIPIVHERNEYFARLSTYKAGVCDHIVAVSPAVKAIVDRVNRRCKCDVILHGIPKVNVDTTERNFLSDSLKLIYVGRIHNSSKGVFLLPLILRTLLDDGVDVTLDIVGDGPDIGQLKDLFRDNGVEKFVTYWGMISSEQVYTLMHAAHALLFPSYTEGLGITPIEAQLCGCVPIASLLVGATDCTIQDNKTGFLVDNGEVKQFSKAIKQLYFDRQLLVHMSRQARDYAENHFSLEHMGAQYHQLIQTALKSKNKSSLICDSSYSVPKTEKLINKKVILWGTGSNSEALCKVLPFKVAYFVDNNPLKWQCSVNGLNVYSPEKLLQEHAEKIMIVIACNAIEEISIQLSQMGFLKDEHFTNIFEILEPKLLLRHYLELMNLVQ